MKKQHHILLFLVAYAAYALLYMLSNQFDWSPMIAILVPLTVMVYLIFVHHKHQDEVMKKIHNQAYLMAFWVIFLVLFVMNFLSFNSLPFLSEWPLWTVPLIAWHLAYLVAWFKNT